LECHKVRNASRSAWLVVCVFAAYLACSLLPGCKPKDDSKLAKFGEAIAADLSGTGQAEAGRKTPLLEARACEKCGELAGENHDCRLTHYCSICRRDIGEEHVCGVTTLCTTCYAEKGSQHECLLTSFCKLCRTDVAANHLYERSTRKCFTSYCPGCKADVGKWHICGVTHFCPRCRREVAGNHVCDLTRLCAECNVEVAREVLCGRCGKALSRAEGPEAGLELVCPNCGVRKEKSSYRWGIPIDCEGCGVKGVLPAVKCRWCGETCPPVTHQCGVTHFCPKCKKEVPLDGHKH
jgi:phage FluMu protein Com